MGAHAGLAGMLALSLLAVPPGAEAQAAKPVPRVAFLGNGTAATSGPLLEALRAGLPGPDVVVAAGPQPLRELKRATAPVPVVMAIISDPVEEGLIASLARPGGNLTGVAFQNQALTMKRLELLKEAIPKISRVAVLWDRSFGVTSGVEQAESAAQRLRIRSQRLAVRGAGELEAAFEAAARERADALLVLASPFLNANRQIIVDLASRRHLPASFEAKSFVEAGGLMSYGPSFPDMYRQAAVYVDKILKGAKPGDLPVEQAAKFELAVNSRTAKTLGLILPPALLARADQVLQ